MKLKIRSSLIKNLIHNVSGVLFSLVIPLILIPIYINGIGLDEYGKYVAALSLAFFVSIVSDIGMDMYIGKEVSINRDDRCKLSELYTSYVIIKSISLIVFIPILGLLLKLVSNIDGFLYFCIYCVFLSFKPTCIFNGLEWFKKLNVIEISCKLPLVFVVYFISLKTNGLNKIILLQIIYQGIQTAIMHYLILRNKIEIKQLPKYEIINDLKKSFGYYISRMFVSGYSQASPYFASLFISSNNVAIYSVALQLFKVGLAILSAINNVVYIRVVHNKNYKIVFKTLGFIILSLLAFSPVVVFWGDIILEGVFKENIDGLHSSSIILYVALIFSSISSLCGYPILVAAGKDILAHVTVIISSSIYYIILVFLYFVNIINVDLNVLIFLVLITEIVSSVTRVYFVRNEIRFVINCVKFNK